jgi:ATP-dependent DNA helicase PIF1
MIPETCATGYLNAINLPTRPLHELKLKIAVPVILLRNLSPPRGLCDGTRLGVNRVQQRIVECEILSGQHAGTHVWISRIPLAPSSDANLPFDLNRTQFPLRCAFAITINKSQGQSLTHVGLSLTEAVFSHGQLYHICRIVSSHRQCKSTYG